MKNNFLFIILLLSFLSCTQSKKNDAETKTNIETDLKAKIDSITNGKNAIVGVSVKGIDFPFEYNNANANAHLPMLSVFKFHIAAAVLNEVDERKLQLEQIIDIKKSELLENTHSPLRDEFPNGTKMPISEIIRYTVAQSDNNGCDILLRLIGGTETVQEFMNSKEVKDFQIKYNEEWMHKGAEYLYPNYTSTKSLTQLLIDFNNGKILSKESTNFLMKVMLETSTGTNKLKEQLPKGTPIAHKTGASGKNGKLTVAENDAGIITLSNEKKYAISVFVKDSQESDETNCKMISDISKTVWDFLNETKLHK